MNINDEILQRLASRSSVYLALQAITMKQMRIARKHEDLPTETTERLKDEETQQMLIQIARDDCRSRGLNIPDPCLEHVVRFLYGLDSSTDVNSEVA